jgi:hypothetical protein
MPKPSTDERRGPLVKEKKKLDLIQERFKYADQAWTSIRKEAKEDMRHVFGDPWEPKEKLARKNAMRPTPANDEISQYLNQVVNGVRENKRAIDFNPVGFGADEKTAEFYGNKWREIWYRSHAQQHTTRAFQNMVERSYGYVKVRTEYVTDTPGSPQKPWSAFDQRLVIDGLPDPDCVYPDPDFLDATGRDWSWLFEIEKQTLSDFRRNFPNAEIQSFSTDLIKYSKDWITGSGKNMTLRIASYWEVEKEREILNAWELRNPKTGATEVYELFDHEAELTEQIKKFKAKLIDKREVETPTVTQYRTNGVEILKKTEWPGKAIPYVAFYGKMLWLDLGTGPELVIESMVRHARGPNMMLAYYLACELELIGATPKTPWWVWKGSVDPKNAVKIQQAAHLPVPFIEINPTLGASGTPTPSLPTRIPFEPPIQAIEIAKEASRRAIQAAMGLTPLPTSAQRQNEKSGVALKQIEESGQRGSYHFLDSYDMGLVRLGELGEDLIPKIHDTAGPTPVLDNQKRPKEVFINAGMLPEGTQAPQDALKSIDGLHAVTIEVEPDFASQRDKGSDFVTNFIGSPIFQALPPEMGVRILALMVKLLDLGPIGNEIADILHPPDQGEQAQMVPLAKHQEAIALGDQMIKALQAELQKAEQEKKAKVIETEGRRVIAAEGNETKKQIAALDAETKLADREKQSDTMILLQKMKEQLEMLTLHVTSEQQARELSADVQKTGAELEHATMMAERGHAESAREGREGREHQSAESAASRESADRNSEADRKLKAKQAAAKPKASK